MAIVTAYRKDTGQAVQVSESILNSPRLGRPFTRTAPAEPVQAPPTRVAEPTPPTPLTSRTIPVREPAPASGDTNPKKEH